MGGDYPEVVVDREDYGYPSGMSLPTYMGSFPAPGSYAPGSFMLPYSSYPYAGDSMPTSMYGGGTDQETDDRPTEVEEDPTEPPATVDLTGKAMFIGLLSGCTVGADLDGDGKVSGDEPTDTTDDFGGWTLTVDEDEVDPDGILLGPVQVDGEHLAHHRHPAVAAVLSLAKIEVDLVPALRRPILVDVVHQGHVVVFPILLEIARGHELLGQLEGLVHLSLPDERADLLDLLPPLVVSDDLGLLVGHGGLVGYLGYSETQRMP